MPQTEYLNQTRPDPVPGSPEDQHHQRGAGFESMPVIDAVPISMVAPEDVLAESTPKVTKRRSMEEMAKRPEWLPEDWRIDLRVRTSGASTGLIDRCGLTTKQEMGACYFCRSRSYPDWTYNVQIGALQTLAFIQLSMYLAGNITKEIPLLPLTLLPIQQDRFCPIPQGVLEKIVLLEHWQGEDSARGRWCFWNIGKGYLQLQLKPL